LIKLINLSGEKTIIEEAEISKASAHLNFVTQIFL
jgi:hypothetical protein